LRSMGLGDMDIAGSLEGSLAKPGDATHYATIAQFVRQEIPKETTMSCAYSVYVYIHIYIYIYTNRSYIHVLYTSHIGLLSGLHLCVGVCV